MRSAACSLSSLAINSPEPAHLVVSILQAYLSFHTPILLALPARAYGLSRGMSLLARCSGHLVLQILPDFTGGVFDESDIRIKFALRLEGIARTLYCAERARRLTTPGAS